MSFYKFLINTSLSRPWSVNCSLWCSAPLVTGSAMKSTRQGLSMVHVNFKCLPQGTLSYSSMVRLMPIRLDSTSLSRTLKSLARNSAKDLLIFLNNNRYYLVSTYVLILVAMPVAAYNSYVISTSTKPDKVSRNQKLRSSIPFMLFSSVLVLTAFASVKFMLSRTFLRITYNESSQQFVGIRCTWRLAKERVVFRPGSVKQIGGQASSWREFLGNVSIEGRPYYLPLADFKSTYHYNLMLGLVK